MTRSLQYHPRPATYLLAVASLLTACDGDSDTDAADAAMGVGDAVSPLTLAQKPALVTDWLNHRLDLVDLAALESGATREDVVVASMDLSEYHQGPLNAEVTPDGKLALVSLSDGFFGLTPLAATLVGTSDIPTGEGRVIVVDLERFEVLGEIDTGNGPMGILFTEDATRAVVAHFGTNSLAVLDVAAREVVEQVEVGIYSEEIAADDRGEVGIFSYSAGGNVRSFGTGDLSGTLSPDVELTGDAAGVAFFPGTQSAYVVQAPMPLTGAQGGHTVLDVSDPSAPVVLDDVRSADAPTAYPVAPAAQRDTVVVPTVLGGVLGLDEIALEDDGTASIVQQFEVGEAGLFGAYGVVVDDAGRALLSVPASKEIIVVDLAAGTHFDVPWGGADAGPTDIALIP